MNARGFTLIEWLIAMLIGVFLVGGGLSIFVASRATTEDAFDQSELQENGRIAMRLVTQDLKWAGFWGDYTGSPMATGQGVTLSSGSTVLSANDCLDNLGRGSLPPSVGTNRGVWVARVDNNRAINGGAFACIPVTSRIANTDVISIKRLIGQPLADAAATGNRFYLATTTQAALMFKGGETVPTMTDMPARQLWEYQHFIYYLAPNAAGNPELRKRYLTANGGSVLIGGPMAEGIERMTVLFGVDDTPVADGVIDRYVASTNVTEQEWSEGRVVAARVFILVRSSQASSSYVNNNIYQVGSTSVSGNGDGFRRLLLESSVSLRNPVVMTGGGS
ncbi:PilW family protein [Aeromonas caviae]|uniref:PilW family protein n=1 Tax=Aeromonas caviae TaxID=648 RepID=A0AAF0GDG0_AERCA|nr:MULTISPECIES: PilW family protein [Aeromonas]MCR3939099.1 PilW family protein [Aeromonas caviae]MCR3946933.1 PilW family protein [Aeromonas caviae]MCR9024156.1 PilW family protein [Aeromonas caviae]MCY9812649.1 PilW family protein [Aeromonas caviae]MDH1633891.1 PilW family protein [Aeromonas caviae]